MHRLQRPIRPSSWLPQPAPRSRTLTPLCPSLERVQRSARVQARPNDDSQRSEASEAGPSQISSEPTTNPPTAKSASASDASASQTPSASSGDGSRQVSSPEPASSFTRNPKDPLDTSLSEIWEQMKVSMKEGMSKEEAELLDSVTYDEIMAPDNQVFRRLAQAQFGSAMAELGLEKEDPLEFLVGILSVGVFLQFVSVGMLFYSSELLGHLDAGDALRVACGLATGYLLRPFFRVETIFAPIYNGILGLAGVQALYTGSRNDKDIQSTLNSLGILIAVLFLAPKLLWGWDVEDCSQFIAPVPFGLFLSDFTFMLALFVKYLL